MAEGFRAKAKWGKGTRRRVKSGLARALSEAKVKGVCEVEYRNEAAGTARKRASEERVIERHVRKHGEANCRTPRRKPAVIDSWTRL